MTDTDATEAIQRMTARETTRLVERVRENCVRLLGAPNAGRAMFFALYAIERSLRAGREQTEAQIGISLEPKPEPPKPARPWWAFWRSA